MEERFLFAILAIAVPFISMPFVPIIGKAGDRARAWFSVLMGTITAIFTLLLLGYTTSGSQGSFDWIPVLNIRVGIFLDGLSVFVAVIAGVIGALALLYSVKYMEHVVEEGYSLSRYYVLTLLFIGAMIGLALTDNLIALYIFWEIVGFCSYSLIAYYYKDPKALRGGTKAFIVTRFGDIGFLVAVVALWHGAAIAGISNPLSLDSLIRNFGSIDSFWLSVAGIGVIMGAIGKSAQVPLQVWLPDAMEAPTTITALIHAATMVNAGVYLVARTFPIFSGFEWWLLTLAYVGSITAFLAGVIALAERDIKRVLAYSTISQIGYMVAAVGFSSVLAAQLHLFSHAIFKALLFLGAGAVIHTVGTRDMFEMGGLKSEMKITRATFLIGVLALMGIPIFNGFWSKDLILGEGLKPSTYFPLLLLILTVFLTVAYSWRMYYLTFEGESRRKEEAHEVPWHMSLPLVILAIGSVISWVGIYQFTGKMKTVLYSNVEIISLQGLAEHVFFNPLIGVTVIAILLLAYLVAGYKEKMLHAFSEPTGTVRALNAGLGFDYVYLGIVKGIRGFGQRLRSLQTGDLNYNMIGVGLGIILLFLFLFLAGGF